MSDIRKSKLRDKVLEYGMRIRKYDGDKIIISFKDFHYYTISKIEKELDILIHFEYYNGSRNLIALNEWVV